jgi:hypothetical protein
VLNAMLQRFIRILAVAGPLALAPLGAQADDLRAVARYAVTLGGTQIATANVSLSDAGGSYSLALDAKISGLAQLVANGTARLESTGTSTVTGLKSQKFDMLTRANGEAFTVAVTYANGGVNSFIVDPPIINNIDRVAIERKHLTNSNDMAAPFVVKGGKLDASLCDRQMPIFTGVERFNLTLRYAKDDVATSKRTGYQGPVVVCSVKYTPISGHYTTSEMTTYLSQSNRILIWYAPLKAEGYFIPYRALITTEAGDLSVVLTDLEQ